MSAKKKLEDMRSREPLALHNELAAKPAGPKTFSTKAKLLDRIRSLQATQATAKKAPSAKPRAPRPKAAGATVGALARSLLMDPAGYPHALIAAMVNRQIEGARATAQSVRWYAAKMRKEGVRGAGARAGPPRRHERGAIEGVAREREGGRASSNIEFHADSQLPGRVETRASERRPSSFSAV